MSAAETHELPEPRRGRAANQYSTWSPDMPGCVATGDDIDECASNLRAAIAFSSKVAAEGQRLLSRFGRRRYVAHAAWLALLRPGYSPPAGSIDG